MASTTRGLRKPVSTDPVKDGATAIGNLADDVDTKIGVFYSVIVNVAGLATGTPVLAARTFPAGRFPGPPRVVATANATTNPQNFDVSVVVTDADNYTVAVTRRAGSTASLPVAILAHY